MTNRFLAALAGATILSSPALAQEHDHSQMDHSGRNAPPVAAAGPPPAAASGHHDHAAKHFDPCPSPPPSAPVGGEMILQGFRVICAYSGGSGTSRLPSGTSGAGHAGLHLMSGDWMMMAHGFVTAQYTDHSGPRGDDKLYSTSMLMVTGTRDTSWGSIQLKSMMSLEPAMKARGYPNLFATGETAGGLPLVDRQHPHDLFMELAARVDIDIAAGTRLFVYGGPVGEPAIGPSAFMMRPSARYNPEPPVTHHWFDSTHITYGVVTAGLYGKTWQIEGSAFRGSEPDEHRWDIETPRLDSFSVRGTLNPSPDWSLQASYALIEEPEAIHPGQDERRFTASAHYGDWRGRLSATLAFSAKKRVPGDTVTAWLGEANWNLDRANTLFGRVENVANDELFPDHDDPLHDVKFRVTKFQLGYARRFKLDPFELALGGSGAVYAKPDALDAAYGKSPFGYTVFAKLSLGN